MVKKAKDLTFFEATAIITGYGVGAGIMAVPYLTSLSGIFSLCILLGIAYFISLLLHFMIAEMMLRDGKSSQLVEIMGKYLFSMEGNRLTRALGNFFMWFFFLLIVIAFYASLLGYVSGGGEILNTLFGIPQWLGFIIFYIIAAGVVFFGLKIVGVSEKYAIALMVLLVAVLVALSFVKGPVLDFSIRGDAREVLALFGMLMFSFVAFFSIPQAVKGLQWKKRLIPWAVVCGLGLNFIFIVLITLMAVGVSKEVTKIAIIGWSLALGKPVLIIGSLFVLFAILTSFWSISLAFAVILEERLKWKERLAWFAATAPVLLIALLGLTDFLGFLTIAGGGIGFLVAILIVPTYVLVKKNGPVKKPAWEMGKLGGWIFLALVTVGYILMAVGSALSPAFD